LELVSVDESRKMVGRVEIREGGIVWMKGQSRGIFA